MFKIYLLSCFFFAGTLFLFSQSTGHNYIKTTTYKTPTANPIANPGPGVAAIQVSYHDGLGRPVQQVAHRQSGNGEDIITHLEYDQYGRQIKEYLPYERSASLIFDQDALLNNLGFYNTSYFGNTTNPYSEKEMESSPLNRVLKQAAPGHDWMLGNGKEIRLEYGLNNATDVWKFTVVLSGNNPSLTYNNNDANYPAGTLHKNTVKDENTGSSNGGTTLEFKNNNGQVLLKRLLLTSSLGNDNIDTYYIYDSYGNLTYVLPPKLSGQIISNGSLVGNYQALLDELGYQYSYDERNRLIVKKLPGRQEEFIAYDALDRVIAVGPVNSPFKNLTNEGWLRTKYDDYNRVAYTFWQEGSSFQSERGLIQSSTNQGQLSEKRISGTNQIGGVSFHYTNNVAPVSGYHLLTINYYDDYDFPWAPVIPATIEGKEVHYNNTDVRPKGLPTGGWVRVLESSNDVNATKSYSLYDVKSRPLRNHTINYMGGYTQQDLKYSHIGNVLKQVTRHKKQTTDTETLIEELFTYTDQERLVTHTHKLDNKPVQLLSLNQYDAIGQLITKKVGGTDILGQNPLQKVDYKYNIRGWLTDINNFQSLSQNGAPLDLFAFRIHYNMVSHTINGNVSKLYNGNIAETFWRTSSDNILRKYGYKYDNLNRMLDAWYQVPYIAAPLTNSYNEHLTYDANGNITTLERNGEVDQTTPLMIDDLVYSYDTGNKLLKVDDLTTYSAGFNDGHTAMGVNDFEYDDYGNLILDRNKGITDITYNHLNLPVNISFGSKGTIEYLYDVSGIKLKKKVTNSEVNPIVVNTTHYLGGFQYKEDKLDFFPHSEGYVKVLDSRGTTLYHYVFNYTDHLGNIRVSYALDPGTNEVAILEENHFYPFGLKHNGYNPGHIIVTDNKEDHETGIILTEVTQFLGDSYKYKFGGKELQEEFGIGMYDFGARNYDPAIGRWMNIDPLAEQMRRHSPYNYVFNNPIVYIDPDGMSPDWYSDNDGNIVHDESITSQEDLDNKGIDGDYIAESFLGEDQNGQVFVFGSDGGVSYTPGADTSAYTAGGVSEDSFVSIESTEVGTKSGDNIALAGNTVASPSSTNPIAALVNVLAGLSLLTTAAIQMNDSNDMQFEFAKSKKGKEGDVSGSEHTSGARKSTKTKHEKGQTRNQQKNTDKKRNKSNWKQNPNNKNFNPGILVPWESKI